MVERVAALVVESAEHRDDGRRGVREELPQLLARRGVEPERAVLVVELEVVAEHVLHVILAAPLRRLAPLERFVRELAVELTELRVGLPRGETETPACADHTRQLGRDVRVVGRPDERERRQDDVEVPVVERQVLGIGVVAVEVEEALALLRRETSEQLLPDGRQHLREAIVRCLVADLPHDREHTPRHA